MGARRAIRDARARLPDLFANQVMRMVKNAAAREKVFARASCPGCRLRRPGPRPFRLHMYVRTSPAAAHRELLYVRYWSPAGCSSKINESNDARFVSLATLSTLARGGL
jgi:hypothetical protein